MKRERSEQLRAEPELPQQVRTVVYVVIPAYNEGPRLGSVLREVGAHYPNVIVVDDGSVDDTGAVARRAGRHVLVHRINRGQGAALQTGIEHAVRCGAEYVVTFDADGQHRVEDVARLLTPILAGDCEVTLGSRFLGAAIDLPWSRRVTLRLAVWFTRLVSRVWVSDTHNGLRALSRRAALQVDLRMDGMAHASEFLDFVRRARLSFEEVPVRIRYTPESLAKGQSSLNAMRIALQYLVDRISR